MRVETVTRTFSLELSVEEASILKTLMNGYDWDTLPSRYADFCEQVYESFSLEDKYVDETPDDIDWSEVGWNHV